MYSKNRPESVHCLVMKDQWDCVLNDFEELEGTEFLVLTGQCSIEIFYCCLRLLPCCSSIHHQTNIESTNLFWIFCSPEFDRSIIFSRYTPMTKKIDQFLGHWVIGERTFLWFNISRTSLLNRYSSCGWAVRNTSLWFCLRLWSTRKSTCIRFQRIESSNCNSEFSCSFLSCSLLLRMAVVHRLNSNFHSIFTLWAAGCDFKCGSNLSVHPNPTLWNRAFFHPLTTCTHDRPLNLWVVKTMQCLLSWKLSDFNCVQESCISTNVQILITLSWCDFFSIRSWYLCNRSSSCAGSSVKGMCAFIALGTNNGLDCHGRC